MSLTHTLPARSTRARRFRFAAALVALTTALGAPAWANSIVEQQTTSLNTGDIEQKPVGLRNGSLIVAPIPFSNPMIGAGLTLGAGYLFQLDASSKPSVFGAAALRSDNGSRAAAAGAAFNFDDNRWQMSLFAGRADVQYDLYAGNLIIPLRQEGNLARLSLAYGFTHDASLGFVTRYLDTQITTQSPLFPDLPIEFQPVANLGILNTGFEAVWDTRDDTLYPTSGIRLKASYQHGFVIEGSAPDYDKGFVLLDSYMSLGENTVLASRSAICAATDTAPFFDSCSVGGIDAFRGFNSTQILGDRSLSAQIELRQRVTQRLGVVAFAGIGGAGSSFSDLSDTGSAGGFGLRYRVSKKFPVDFTVDGSINDQQEKQLYISVGQRF